MFLPLLLTVVELLQHVVHAAADATAVVQDTQHNLHVPYNNVFFREPPHMKGRPSTSFVMVKSVDGRAYQLATKGQSFSYSSPGTNNDVHDVFKRQPELSPCPPMSAKPTVMCVNTTDTCSLPGQYDVGCPNFNLCCFDGCVNTCQTQQNSRLVLKTPSQLGSCPLVDQKTEEECSNSTANCWSRGVPDVDCPDFGLCCFDGCVNTCKLDPEPEEEYDLEYDESLGDAIDEDDDEEYDEELDDNLDDYLDDEDIDTYGAPSAPIINAIDTYGSPLGSVLDFDSYGSPKSDPLTEKSSSKEPTFSGKVFNIIPESSFFKPSIYNQKSKAVKSQILQKTQPYPKSKAVFIPSQQIQTIFPIIQKQDHPKRISRKKLFLKEKKKEKEHVFVTLEKFWKKHFGVFTNF